MFAERCLSPVIFLFSSRLRFLGSHVQVGILHIQLVLSHLATETLTAAEARIALMR